MKIKIPHLKKLLTKEKWGVIEKLDAENVGKQDAEKNAEELDAEKQELKEGKEEENLEDGNNLSP